MTIDLIGECDDKDPKKQMVNDLLRSACRLATDLLQQTVLVLAGPAHKMPDLMRQKADELERELKKLRERN